MTKSRDDVTMIQKLCLKGNPISTAFSSLFLKKSQRRSLKTPSLCGYSICARLRLARGEGLGRSALNNPQKSIFFMIKIADYITCNLR